MRPYLELEKQVAEALGWTEVIINGDLDFGGWSTAWHNQTILYGVPPGKAGFHPPEFLVPRYIYEGKVKDLISELDINVEWYNNSVGARHSYVTKAGIHEPPTPAIIIEKFSDHPNKHIAFCVALCKMIVLIKQFKPKEV